MHFTWMLAGLLLVATHPHSMAHAKWTFNIRLRPYTDNCKRKTKAGHHQDIWGDGKCNRLKVSREFKAFDGGWIAHSTNEETEHHPQKYGDCELRLYAGGDCEGAPIYMWERINSDRQPNGYCRDDVPFGHSVRLECKKT